MSDEPAGTSFVMFGFGLLVGAAYGNFPLVPVIIACISLIIGICIASKED